MKETKQKSYLDGRPPLFGEPLKRLTVYIRPDQFDWIDSQTDKNKSEVLRELIDKAMNP